MTPTNNQFPDDPQDDPRLRPKFHFTCKTQPGSTSSRCPRDPELPLLDFAIKVPGIGRFDLAVKGGKYSLEHGQ